MPNRSGPIRRSTPDVSVIVPVKNEAPSIRSLFDAVGAALAGRTFEVLFVDDGSTDASAEVLRELVRHDPRARALRLRANFGKSAALSAGFREARGAVVVTIDGDLQDEPGDIPAMIDKLGDGVELVSGWKVRRRDSWTRRAASKVFNAVTRSVTGVRLHDFNCGLKAYTAACAKDLAPYCYGELHRYLPAIAHDRGFGIAEMPVRHHPRLHGKSRYGLERYFRGLLDLITVVFTSKYARRPLHAFGGVGSVLLVLSVAGFASLAVQHFAFGSAAATAGLAAVSALALVIGMQFILTGLVAEVVARPRSATVPFAEVPLFHSEGMTHSAHPPSVIVLSDVGARDGYRGSAGR
ncbi:MAG: glycosyltransferase family 2 protein [Actinomycetota bacterium]